MEAAPRLPMLYFDLKVCTENTKFAPQLKQYIAAFYNEDPDSYLTEIHNLETLRAAAVRPSMDVNGVQLLKKYYCQLHFLKSRFPMEENQDAAVQFLWKDGLSGMNCGSSDIRFELMVIMYNIGALHTYLGAMDSRSNPDGMKMACTHFQCAAWAFQTVKEKYHQFIIYISSVELVHFYQQVCLAQAQECILEKSMLDNRKATIIAKVAVQVYNYYRQSWTILQSTNDEVVGSRIYKEWTKYLEFKIAYHKCIALLFQGQQAEEQQKMGERVAFYQAACEQLEEARKLSTSLKHRQQEINESLAFTLDVVEGKRKAAKNENEFIYHEEVPDKDHLQEVKGASLVKGIPFSVNDTEVSGPDIFARLVPMEAHEAASLYSEKKAQMLRQIGELVENKDQSLAEFMSSMQLDLLTKMNQATGIPQELIDRAAALSAKPTAIQDLVDIMGKLSNIYQEVESNLKEIDALLKQEEEAEKGYQELMGKRPPSIIATDLSREAAKYKEAHTKANDSNQTLHRAMMAHMANLKILQQPLRQLQQQLPSVELPNSNIDEGALKDLETLVAKVEEMRTQRAMLWAQFREAVHKDDITNSLVTKQPNQSLEQLFQQELQKHQELVGVIEQNCTAQENIKKALVDCYAKAVNTRRYVQEVIQKRSSTVSALISSFDSYEDLLAKANKGIEFYTKLETNVSKLLQRIRSACEVQREEREQMLSKSDTAKPDDTMGTVAPAAPVSTTPKLKDYLESRKKNAGVAGGYPDPNLPYQQQQVNYGLNVSQTIPDTQSWPPAVRPTPVGSEVTDLPKSVGQENVNYSNTQYGYNQQQLPSNVAYSYQSGGYSAQPQVVVDQDIINRMNSLLSNIKGEKPSQRTTHYSYSNYVPQHYSTTTAYSYPTQPTSIPQPDPAAGTNYDPNKAYTSTTNSYRPVSSYSIPNSTNTHMQYPNSSLGGTGNEPSTSGGYQYPNYAQQAQNTGYSQAEMANQSGSHTQTNVNTYYPSGYAPNYTGQSQGGTEQNVSVSGQVQYHSLQYATSVQPNQMNYSYNSTYSSPITNMASAQVKDDKLMATGLPSGATSQVQTPYSSTSAATSQAYVNPAGTSSLTSIGQIYSPYSNHQMNTSSSVTSLPSSYAAQSSYPTSDPHPSYSTPANSTSETQSTYSTPATQTGYITSYTQPTYLSSGNQSNYTSSGAQSPYPASDPQSTYPTSAVQSTYPTSAAQPTYPTSAAQSTYLTSAHPTYPASASQSTYPNSASQSTYPTSAAQSTYPTSAAQPTYPTSATPSNYPAPNSSYATNTPQSYASGVQQYYPDGANATGTYQGYATSGTGSSTTQLYQTGSLASLTDQNAGAAGYGTYPGYYPGYTQYPQAGTPQQTTQTATPTPPKTKESNIDLLSGLDFTINHAPLIPQQNVAAKTESKEVQPVVSESKTSVTKAVPQKEETPVATSQIKRLSVKILPSKPLSNNDVKGLFMQEIEKYEKYVETLTNKTLSGPTNLDIKWKEIQDKQDAEGQKRIISVARCYPMKNRFPDILPYDYSRVELNGTKDDYINASYVYDVSPYAPPFIVTQTPMSSTCGDFWTMIKEQQVELIFCIANDNEIGDDVYWPKEKGKHLNILNMVVSLQSVIVKSHWVERLISVNVPEKKESWVVMQLQFTSWPGSLFPTTPEPFIGYVLELITLYQQQRCATHPVVVHCASGIGRSGLVCLLTVAIYDVTNNANSVPDLACLASKLTNCRKNILRDREHLKFAYEAFLAYMKQIVNQEKMKKKLNEVVPKQQQEEVKQPVEVVEKNEDPLSTLDPFWANKK